MLMAASDSRFQYPYMEMEHMLLVEKPVSRTCDVIRECASYVA